MPVQIHEQIPDTLPDEVGDALRALERLPRWTQAKHDLFNQIVARAQAAGYLAFPGHYRTYQLTRKGSVCLYDVPHQQRGALRAWAGQRVRLICTGAPNGYGERFYLAHPVPRIP